MEVDRRGGSQGDRHVGGLAALGVDIHRGTGGGEGELGNPDVQVGMTSHDHIWRGEQQVENAHLS